MKLKLFLIHLFAFFFMASCNSSYTSNYNYAKFHDQQTASVRAKALATLREDNRLTTILSGTDTNAAENLKVDLDSLSVAATTANGIAVMAIVEAFLSDESLSGVAISERIAAMTSVMKAMAANDDASLFAKKITYDETSSADFERTVDSYLANRSKTTAEALDQFYWTGASGSAADLNANAPITAAIIRSGSSSASGGLDNIDTTVTVLTAAGITLPPDSETQAMKNGFGITNTLLEAIGATTKMAKGMGFDDASQQLLVKTFSNIVNSAGDGMAQVSTVVAGRTAISMLTANATIDAITQSMNDLSSLFTQRQAIAVAARGPLASPQDNSAANRLVAQLNTLISEINSPGDVALTLNITKDLTTKSGESEATSESFVADFNQALVNLQSSLEAGNGGSGGSGGNGGGGAGAGGGDNTGFLVTYASEPYFGTLPSDGTFYSDGDVVTVADIGNLESRSPTYFFNGWNTAANGSGTTYQPGSTFTIAGSNVTLHAQYQSATLREWRSVTSSIDGTKMAAVEELGQIYTSTDSGASWTARETNRRWLDIASSDDGTKLVAVAKNDNIYTSTDSGITWTARDSVRNWNKVISSSDGAKLVATVSSGQIYTSTDSGASWTARDSSRFWIGLAGSSDGANLSAVVSNGQIYTSTDSGATWTTRESTRSWSDITSSSDGTKLAAVVGGGQIYTSTDSGVTWTARDSSRGWGAISSSSDGTKLVAIGLGELLYTSDDSGVTWTGKYKVRSWADVVISGDGNKIAAQTLTGVIYTSYDFGSTMRLRF